jgi:filamentous hemagglutinin family protein
MKYKPDYSSRFRVLKGGKISLVVSALLGGMTILSAAPSGGVVTSGSATISQNGTTTNINQTSQKTTINWQNFSIAANESVNFVQPNVNAIALNRVVGNERSVIDGALTANGQVWILNSNGVLFNSTASINTAGLVATTASLSDEDFNAGNYNFKSDSIASVINMGTINISDGGYASLLANTVSNEGTINAIQGTVHLTGASEATINLNGNSLVTLKVNKGVLDALVENKGAIIADGGKIYLTTNAVDELLKGVVNNTGLIEANSIDDMKSEVILFAHGGTANISGSIIADGSFVETSGDRVKISDDFKIQAKDWLIDPVDFTIAASGGDITGSAVSAALGTTNVTIQTADIVTCTGVSDCGSGTGTNGDIFVNDTITWNSANDLTLNAFRNIYINESITATDAGGKLTLEYGQGAHASGNTANYYVNAPINLNSGQNFSTKLGNDLGNEVNYTVINDATALQSINSGLTGNYALGSDIDLQGIAWTSIGHSFGGKLDGLGHEVSNLSITASGDYQSFIRITTVDAVIQNIGLTNININASSNYYFGGLVGQNKGTIFNSYTTGTITGGGVVGGLVGYNVDTSGSIAKILNSYSSVNINSDMNKIGGLVGYTAGYQEIKNSYATGSVSGNTQVGGLVGDYENGTVINSYSTGSVSGNSSIGGLIGNKGLAASNAIYSFWDTETSGLTTSASGTPKTTADFANPATFTNWDTSVWSFRWSIGSWVWSGFKTLSQKCNKSSRYSSIKHSFCKWIRYRTKPIHYHNINTATKYK